MSTTALSGLQAKIKLILSQVEDNARYKYRTALAALASAPAARSTEKNLPTILSPGEAEMAHEQVVALRTLYAQSPPSQQGEFVPFLISQITVRNAAVIVHALLEIGGLTGLLNALKNPKAFDFSRRRFVWRTIREKLAHESHRFTETDLSLIEEVRVSEDTRARIFSKVKRIEPPPRIVS